MILLELLTYAVYVVAALTLVVGLGSVVLLSLPDLECGPRGRQEVK